MARTIWVTLITMFVLPACLSPLRADELDDRLEIRRHVSKLFRAEDFSELDRLAEGYRADESRTGSGTWKITQFYLGLTKENPPCTCDRAAATAFADIEHIEARYQRWIYQHPESLAARIAYASTLVDHAWLFRGSKWAADVLPEAWEPYREYLAKARRYLLEHKSILRTDAQWYWVMLVIAKGENWPLPLFRALVDEAVAEHPYYYEVYFKAIDYLLPKWHGNTALIEEFADYAVEKTQEKDGIGIYARIYWYASHVEFGHALFSRSQVDWEKMAAGIDDVLARYPDQWNINNFARFACLAEDRGKARELSARVIGAPIAEAWTKQGPNLDECRAWANG